MDRQKLKSSARKVLDPVVRLLAALGVPPLMISLLGVAVSLYGAALVADGGLFFGGVLLLAAGLCDVVDGDLARRGGTSSRFGAFVDSTLDRVAEFAYFSGIAVFVLSRPGGGQTYELVVVLIALAGSVLTSYARARAEGLGLECTVGIVGRPERITLLALGLLLGFRVLFLVLIIIAVTSLYTFIQRIAHVQRVTAHDSTPSTTPAPTRDSD